MAIHHKARLKIHSKHGLSRSCQLPPASLAKHSRPGKTPSCAAQTENTSDEDYETTDDEISKTNAKGAKRKEKKETNILS